MRHGIAQLMSCLPPTVGNQKDGDSNDQPDASKGGEAQLAEGDHHDQPKEGERSSLVSSSSRNDNDTLNGGEVEDGSHGSVHTADTSTEDQPDKNAPTGDLDGSLQQTEPNDVVRDQGNEHQQQQPDEPSQDAAPSPTEQSEAAPLHIHTATIPQQEQGAVTSPVSKHLSLPTPETPSSAPTAAQEGPVAGGEDMALSPYNKEHDGVEYADEGSTHASSRSEHRESWRDSVAEGTGSLMDSVALTDNEEEGRADGSRGGEEGTRTPKSRETSQIFYDLDIEGDRKTTSASQTSYAEPGPSSPVSLSSSAMKPGYSFETTTSATNGHDGHDHDASKASFEGVAVTPPSLPPRRTAQPAMPTREPSSHDYDFLLHRVDHQNAALREDPKAKRRSLATKEEVRLSFNRLRDEAEHGQHAPEGQGHTNDGYHEDLHRDIDSDADAGEAKRRRASIASLNGTQQVTDWDLWGEIMSDYELMAKTKRT